MWSPLQATINRHLVLSRIERLRILAFVVSGIALLTTYHLWWTALVFWFVPMVSALGFLLRLRSIAEHSVMEMEHPLNTTRHVDATWLEKLTLAPVNVNYHLAHHLYPSVPYYNLPKLHGRLMSCEVFRNNAHITKSYLGLKEGVLGEVLVRGRAS
jgi:fatty acid desaturase